MKIAITGHSRGIGKACADLLGEEHDIHGMSRSNGFDINDVQPIIMSSHTCDVFINNAYSGIQQSILFDALFNMWKDDSTKTIVNLNSRSKYSYTSPNPLYSADKKHLDHIAQSKVLSNMNKRVRVININPGYVDTDMMPDRAKNYNKLTPTKIAETIKWCLDQPPEVEVNELSIWTTWLE
jgi:NADP-dependent 3-hydroxy acid dehydrogenase YdfG